MSHYIEILAHSEADYYISRRVSGAVVSIFQACHWYGQWKHFESQLLFDKFTNVWKLESYGFNFYGSPYKDSCVKL